MVGLTEDDRKRIRKFVTTRSFERTPDLLCPEEDEVEDGDEGGEDEE